MSHSARDRIRMHLRCALILLGLLASASPLRAREVRRAGVSANEAAQAARLLGEARAALQGGDPTTAYRLAAQSYRIGQVPDALFVLGQVALAGKNLLSAQDLLRRYLADPNLEVPVDAPDYVAAQRIVERPRPPAAQLTVSGDRGALVSVDDRVVGVLPLVRPLLIAPGEHKVVLERRGVHLEDIVRVAAGRLAELRVNLATKALVLTVLPGVLLRQTLPGLPGAEQLGFEQALEAGLTARRLSALSERDSAECAEPAPGSCSDPLRCEIEQAKRCESDYVLRTRLETAPGPPRQLQLTVDLIDVSVGAIASRETLRCQSCVAIALREQLPGALSRLLERGVGRGRGAVDVASQPLAAMVLIDGQPVGITPFRGTLFAGGHQVQVRKEGFADYSQPIDVRDGETAPVLASLLPTQAPIESKPTTVVIKQAGRPLWRLLAGGVAIGAGAVLLGFGASALSVNRKCVGSTSTPIANCQTVYNTDEVAGGLFGLSAGLMIGGAVAIAIPANRPKEAASASVRTTP